MPTTYPATKQDITDPSGTQTLAGADHSGLHTTVNDTLEAVQDTVGTTLGTNVLKDFGAGNFPARVNSAGTFVQNLGGGTITASSLVTVTATTSAFNNGTVGTSSLVGGTISSSNLVNGTSTAMKVVGTDILSLSGLLGTSLILSSVGLTVGSFTNTVANDGTNLGSITFTPQVAVTPLILWHANWSNRGIPGTNNANLTINGSAYGTNAGFTAWSRSAWRGTAALVTSAVSGVFVGPSLAAAGTHSIVVPVYTTAGTAVVSGYRLYVVPLPSA